LTETQGSSTGVRILDRIVEAKRDEVAALLPRRGELLARALDAPPPRSFAGALRAPGEVRVIAEVKRCSPGAGAIRTELEPRALARSYETGGAAALSVLTDRSFFGGGLEDLVRAREATGLPVLRKDFVIHEVQLHEARAAGADAVLLIVRILSDPRLRELLEGAAELGMAALVEVHDAEELDRALDAGAAVVGVNNRNLQTFETRLEVSEALAARVPPGILLVAESGIRGPADVDRLGEAGVDAVLVGESLLRAPDPGRAVGRLAGRPRRERSV